MKDEFRKVYEEMTERFQALAKERGDRPDLVERHGEVQLEWIHYEREQMHVAVNEYRRANGMDDVTLEKVMRVETTASGHVDYATKWPLYCAELATGRYPGE